MLTREELIEHIMNMYNGIGQGTPQPEYADYIKTRYDERMPWLDLLDGVKAAMKEKA